MDVEFPAGNLQLVHIPVGLLILNASYSAARTVSVVDQQFLQRSTKQHWWWVEKDLKTLNFLWDYFSKELSWNFFLRDKKTFCNLFVLYGKSIKFNFLEIAFVKLLSFKFWLNLIFLCKTSFIIIWRHQRIVLFPRLLSSVSSTKQHISIASMLVRTATIWSLFAQHWKPILQLGSIT